MISLTKKHKLNPPPEVKNVNWVNSLETPNRSKKKFEDLTIEEFIAGDDRICAYDGTDEEEFMRQFVLSQ